MEVLLNEAEKREMEGEGGGEREEEYKCLYSFCITRGE